MQPQMEPRHHSEEARACTARRPEEIGVLLRAGADQLTGSGDDLDRFDAEARGSPRAHVPTEAAAEHETAQWNARAVAEGKRQAVRCQTLAEIAPGHDRLHRRGPCRRVDYDLVEAPKIEQHAAVPQRRAAPAVT